MYSDYPMYWYSDALWALNRLLDIIEKLAAIRRLLFSRQTRQKNKANAMAFDDGRLKEKPRPPAGGMSVYPN